ncbi:hypothetical protein N8I77_013531 [Diaporthe amygdali]|uniref:NAD(P)-binding domain-containing protein n=1 Tax=Phomopsis amygdali TaxID=1214568 RepID=A0AAD9VWF2_PHOAM|nr:hypothetical protein N8I77_013531 [Diaporthe amygdali]
MKVFLTGATGYIGGDVLASIARQFPSASITALVRDTARAKPIADKYPHVQLQQGDLDSADLIEATVKETDVIINTANGKHIGVVHSIANGIRKSQRTSPICWIQISGASVLSTPDIIHKRFGEAFSHKYNDYEQVSEIISLIQSAPTRAVDQAMLSIARELGSRVRTAIIFPPIIYGLGRGLGNANSQQIPGLCKVAIEKKTAVYVGQGEATWGNVHVEDLSNLITKIVGKGQDKESDPELWNERGLYFVQTGEISWKRIAEFVSQTAQKAQIQASPKSISAQEADTTFAHGSVLFGTNAVCVPERAKKLLGYSASQHGLEQEIPESFQRALDALQT